MNEEDQIEVIYKKMDREQKLLKVAAEMRKETTDPRALEQIDTMLREGRQLLSYYEQSLREVQMRRLGQGVDNMSLGPSGGSTSSGPGSMRPRSADLRNEQAGPPTPPPKDAMSSWSETATMNSYTYSMNSPGPSGSQVPAPYANSPAAASLTKTRPNFTKLGKLIEQFIPL